MSILLLASQELSYPNINFGLYCSASARCTDWICSHPARSAIVRASGLRAELEAQLTSLQFETIQTHAGEKTFEAVVGDLLK
jgi:hypothetical protein